MLFLKIFSNIVMLKNIHCDSKFYKTIQQCIDDGERRLPIMCGIVLIMKWTQRVVEIFQRIEFVWKKISMSGIWVINARDGT